MSPRDPIKQEILRKENRIKRLKEIIHRSTNFEEHLYSKRQIRKEEHLISQLKKQLQSSNRHAANHDE